MPPELLSRLVVFGKPAASDPMYQHAQLCTTSETREQIVLRGELVETGETCGDPTRSWQRVVEMVASGASGGDALLLNRAIEWIEAHAVNINERVRCATAIAIASSPMPVELVMVFARQPVSIAAPVLAHARLTLTEWTAVQKAASPDCVRFMSRISGPPQVEEVASQPWNPASGSKWSERSDVSGSQRWVQGASVSTQQSQLPDLSEAALAPVPGAPFPWPLQDVVQRIRVVGAASSPQEGEPRAAVSVPGRMTPKPRAWGSERLLPLLDELAAAMTVPVRTIIGRSDRIARKSSAEIREDAERISREGRDLLSTFDELRRLAASSDMGGRFAS